MNRRQFNQTAFLAGSAALFGGAAFRVGSPHQAHAQTLPSLPSPESSGIEHIVSVTMENRSFDHFFGWMPNADGKQAGLTYVDTNGVAHMTHSLSGDDTGCPGADPDHSFTGARIEYNGGAMNGFLLDRRTTRIASGITGKRISLSTRPWPRITLPAIVTSHPFSAPRSPIGCLSMLRKPTA
jgi:phospholipase C